MSSDSTHTSFALGAFGTLTIEVATLQKELSTFAINVHKAATRKRLNMSVGDARRAVEKSFTELILLEAIDVIVDSDEFVHRADVRVVKGHRYRLSVKQPPVPSLTFLAEELKRETR